MIKFKLMEPSDLDALTDKIPSSDDSSTPYTKMYEIINDIKSSLSKESVIQNQELMSPEEREKALEGMSSEDREKALAAMELIISLEYELEKIEYNLFLEQYAEEKTEIGSDLEKLKDKLLTKELYIDGNELTIKLDEDNYAEKIDKLNSTLDSLNDETYSGKVQKRNTYLLKGKEKKYQKTDI